MRSWHMDMTEHIYIIGILLDQKKEVVNTRSLTPC